MSKTHWMSVSVSVSETTTRRRPARRWWQSIGAPRHGLLALLWVLAWLSMISVWLPAAAVILGVQLVQRHRLTIAARTPQTDFGRYFLS